MPAPTKNNGVIIIRGRFPIPSGTQLQRATITLNKLLSEAGGNDELVRDQNGSPANLPVVLTALAGSTAFNSTYANLSAKSPRVRAEIKATRQKVPEAKFLVVIDDAQINLPAACTATKLFATLQTRITATEGTHAAVFDGNLTWKCRPNGKLTLATRG